jgi:cytochrome c-type biogenesis protein CcsB
MSSLSYYSFVAALVAVTVAFAMQAISMVALRPRRSLAYAGPVLEPTEERGGGLSGNYASILTLNAFVFLTASLLLRAAATGHGPFASMYEFSVAFAWGVLALHFYFRFRYPVPTLAMLTLPVAIGLLAYAATVPKDVEPLVPALQNQALLTVHVATAIIAYGAFAVAFAAGVLYLVQRRDTIRWLPASAVLDEVGYKAVVVGFPMLALTILLGAIWAEIAWGSYWTWDPKETASLATWLIYGGYLHARVVRDWRGQRSALLLIGGFAATLLTYYGNLFFGGMHSYA